MSDRTARVDLAGGWLDLDWATGTQVFTPFDGEPVSGPMVAPWLSLEPDPVAVAAVNDAYLASLPTPVDVRIAEVETSVAALDAIIVAVLT